MELHEKKCIPCEAGTPPMGTEEIARYQGSVNNAWEVVDGKKLHREFTFKNFRQALAFVNKVGEIAEREGHHPDMAIFYNKVSIDLWTHASSGLTENDFILAAKIDRIAVSPT